MGRGQGQGWIMATGIESDVVVHAMDWYPTLATLAEITIPSNVILDGRDLSALLRGQTETIPLFQDQVSLNAAVPLRRNWNPAVEWDAVFSREEYLNAFFYHGSQGSLAAVRSGKWKLFLNPGLVLYDLEADPGETTPVNNGKVKRKLRGMAILFQEEMRRDARKAGNEENKK